MLRHLLPRLPHHILGQEQEEQEEQGPEAGMMAWCRRRVREELPLLVRMADRKRLVFGLETTTVGRGTRAGVRVLDER
jgi:hypothetical protein